MLNIDDLRERLNRVKGSLGISKSIESKLPDLDALAEQKQGIHVCNGSQARELVDTMAEAKEGGFETTQKPKRRNSE